MLSFPSRSRRGNALFLILIAVALFAALSYAITQSGKGSGSATRETQALAVSQFLQYGAALQQAVTKMTVINGCTNDQINFNYDSDGDGIVVNDAGDEYNNTNSPTDMRCHIFRAEGGGVARQSRPAALGSGGYYYMANIRIQDVGSNSAAEIMLVARTAPDAACLDLNRKGSIPTEADGTPPVADFMNGPDPFDTGGRFAGVYYDTYDYLSAGSGPVANTWRNQYAGCYKTTGGTADGNHFYYVLAAR